MSLDRWWAGWRHEYINAAFADELEDGEGSLFERILGADVADHEAYVVHRGQVVSALLNAYPYNSGHVLVMPNRAVPALDDLTDEEEVALWRTVRQAVAAIQATYRPEGINVGLNLGRAAGAGRPRAPARALPASVGGRHQLHDRRRRDPGAARAPRRDLAAPDRGVARCLTTSRTSTATSSPRTSTPPATSAPTSSPTTSAAGSPASSTSASARCASSSGSSPATTPCSSTRASPGPASAWSSSAPTTWPPAYPLELDEHEALVAATREVGFPVGHASAQMGWRGLRSRPTWRHPALLGRRAPLEARPRPGRRRRRRGRQRLRRGQPRGLVRVRLGHFRWSEVTRSAAQRTIRCSEWRGPGSRPPSARGLPRRTPRGPAPQGSRRCANRWVQQLIHRLRAPDRSQHLDPLGADSEVEGGHDQGATLFRNDGLQRNRSASSAACNTSGFETLLSQVVIEIRPFRAGSRSQRCRFPNSATSQIAVICSDRPTGGPDGEAGLCA